MLDALDGPRLTELLLAEVVGRDLGPLGRLTVDGLDHPARFACSVGDRYDLLADGRPYASAHVTDDALVIAFESDGSRVRIEDGDAVKAGVDLLVARAV